MSSKATCCGFPKSKMAASGSGVVDKKLQEQLQKELETFQKLNKGNSLSRFGISVFGLSLIISSFLFMIIYIHLLYIEPYSFAFTASAYSCPRPMHGQM